MFFRNLFNKFFLFVSLDRRFFIGGEFIENASMVRTERFRDFYRGLRLGSNFKTSLFPLFAIAALVTLAFWTPLVAAISFSALAVYVFMDAVRLHDRWIEAHRCSASGTYRDHPSVPGKLMLLPGPWLMLLLLVVTSFRFGFEATRLESDAVQAADPRPRSGFIFFVPTDLDLHQEVSAAHMSSEFIDEMGDRGISGTQHGTTWIMDRVCCEFFDEDCIRSAADEMQVDHLYFGFVNRMFTLEGEVFAVDIYRYDSRTSETVHTSYDCGSNLRSGQLCMELAAEYFSHR